MGKLAQTDEQLAKIIVDNCETQKVSQRALAEKLGIHAGTLCQIISGKNKGREGVPAAMEAYRVKLALKPVASLANAGDMRANAIRIIEKKLIEAETNDDTKQLIQFLKPYVDMIRIDKPEAGANININIDNHLSFLVKIILEYVPAERRDEAMNKCDEYRRTIEVN